VSVLCVVCQKVTDAFKHLGEGWVCRTCVLSASSIEAVYTIGGKTFTERLKVPMPPRAEAIPIRRGRKA